MLSRYKVHIGSNLPPKDNLRKEDKSSAPKVSFLRRFHCIHIVCVCIVNNVTFIQLSGLVVGEGAEVTLLAEVTLFNLSNDHSSYILVKHFSDEV